MLFFKERNVGSNSDKKQKSNKKIVSEKKMSSGMRTK